MMSGCWGHRVSVCLGVGVQGQCMSGCWGERVGACLGVGGIGSVHDVWVLGAQGQCVDATVSLIAEREAWLRVSMSFLYVCCNAERGCVQS